MILLRHMGTNLGQKLNQQFVEMSSLHIIRLMSLNTKECRDAPASSWVLSFWQTKKLGAILTSSHNTVLGLGNQILDLENWNSKTRLHGVHGHRAETVSCALCGYGTAHF